MYILYMSTRMNKGKKTRLVGLRFNIIYDLVLSEIKIYSTFLVSPDNYWILFRFIFFLRLKLI